MGDTDNWPKEHKVANSSISVRKNGMNRTFMMEDKISPIRTLIEFLDIAKGLIKERF
jgi:hypothetical protein